MVKEIRLTRGKVALVDDEDYEYLSQFKWHFDGRYAKTHLKENGKNVTKRMHTVIMKTPKGKYTDHINLNKLDNRRSNLRICEPFQNYQNTPPMISNTSGYKGVSWDKQKNKWRAKITYQGKTRHIGLYKDKHKAARAYNEKAKELFGEFAWLNEVKEVS